MAKSVQSLWNWRVASSVMQTSKLYKKLSLDSLGYPPNQAHWRGPLALCSMAQLVPVALIKLAFRKRESKYISSLRGWDALISKLLLRLGGKSFDNQVRPTAPAIIDELGALREKAGTDKNVVQQAVQLLEMLPK